MAGVQEQLREQVNNLIAGSGSVDSQSFSVGFWQEGVGLQRPSTYYSKYVSGGLPRWWRDLFVRGLERFLGEFVGIGVSWFGSPSSRVSYPELIEKLDWFGCRYSLPGKWRKKVVKDWRRRSGVVVVELGRDVACYVRVKNGYVDVVQIVGSVRDGGELERIVEFLKKVFGIEVGPRELLKSVVAVKPDPNKLKALSWGVVRAAKDSWVPVTQFSKRVSDAIVEKLDDWTWIDVVSAPRVGKSSGVMLGLVRWVVEKGIDNYVIIVVYVNKKVGRQLYRYALGAWKRVLRDLRALGWSAGMLAEKIRIRYYEGMGSSCLLNKPIHKFEDCLKCPLFQLYHKEWRRVYRFPVPVMDPVILKLSGYCPFQVLFNPVFWRNSIVIINYRLLPLVASILSRLKLMRIVVYFDEYLVQMMHREKLFGLDPRWFENVKDLVVEVDGERISFAKVIDMWNQLVEMLARGIFEYFDGFGFEITETTRKRDEIAMLSAFMKYVESVLRGSVDLGFVGAKLRSEYLRILELLDRFYRRYRLTVFRRLRRILEFVWDSFACALMVRDDRSGGLRFDVVFRPEPWFDGVYSCPGGYIFAFLHSLRASGLRFAVITSSVDGADVGGVVVDGGRIVYVPRIVAPHPNMKYVRVFLSYARVVVDVPLIGRYAKDVERPWVYVRSLNDLFEKLKGFGVSVAVVVDKDSMMFLARKFEDIGYEVVYGSDGDGVVDYVVVRRPDGKVILMIHPHGRCAVGVDPPLRDSVSALLIVLGVRSRPRFIVPVPRFFRCVARLAEGLGPIVFDDGTYAVVRGGVVLVYDVFSAMYDRHVLEQVVGRFFLSRSLRFVWVNPRFRIDSIRYFIFVSWARDDAAARAGRFYRVVYVDGRGKVYDNDFDAWASCDVVSLRMKLVSVEPSELFRCQRCVVDYGHVRMWMYDELRSVYNSLRYCRVQLRYGRQPDRWWLLKKIVALINGFEYARTNGLSVPMGLRTAFAKYVDGGVGALLDYIEERYLAGVADDVWRFIRGYIHRILRVRGAWPRPR